MSGLKEGLLGPHTTSTPRGPALPATSILFETDRCACSARNWFFAARSPWVTEVSLGPAGPCVYLVGPWFPDANLS